MYGLVCVPGITRMQPFSGVAGVSATHADATCTGARFQYDPSWCQLTKVLSPGIFENQLVFHASRLGPSTRSTTSSTRGCVTISCTHWNAKWVSDVMRHFWLGLSASSRLLCRA